MGQGDSKPGDKPFDVKKFLRAARKGDVNRMQSSLRSHDSDVNASSNMNMSALHIACKEGHIEVVKELLQRDVDLHQRTRHGNTALHIAAIHGRHDMVRLLLEHGAQANMSSKRRYTPLYLAVMERHHQVVRELLQQGADLTIVPMTNITLAEVASLQGDWDMVKILRDHKWADSRDDKDGDAPQTKEPAAQQPESEPESKEPLQEDSSILPPVK